MVFGMTGWQEYALAGEGAEATTVLPRGVDPAAAIGVSASPG